MKISSVKTKILGFVLVTTLTSFMILGFYNAVNSYASQKNLIETKEINAAHENAKFIDMYLNSKLNAIVAAIDHLRDEELSSDNPNIVDKLKLAANAGNIEALYIGLEHNGHFIQHNGTKYTPSKDDYDPRKRPWYKDAISLKKSGVTDPYIDFESKKMVVTVFSPMYKNGKLLGVVGADIFIDTVVDTILKININGLGSAHVTNNGGRIIIHKDQKKIGKEDNLFKQISSTKLSNFGETIENSHSQLVAYDTITLSKWKLVIKLDSSIVYDEINSNIINDILLYLLLLAIISACIFFILSIYLSPLKTLEDGFNYFFRFLKGDESNIKELEIRTNDEFGKMSEIINQEMKIIESTIRKDRALIEDVKEVVEVVAQRRFDKRIEHSTPTESLNELKNLLNDMLDKLELQVGKDMNEIINALESYTNRDFTARLDETSGHIGSEVIKLNKMITGMLQGSQKDGLALQNSSVKLTQSVQVLNTNATSQASSLEETAASIEEITSNIEQTSKKAQEMNAISGETKTSAAEGKKLAIDTVNSMDEINSTVIEINEAITVIDQISFQTNILSLNAAVEAATAGEAGKGFAVVAQEVRNLAARSAEAAKDIKELVESATDKANKGKEISSIMIQGFNSLEDKVVDTSKLIEDVTTAAKKQTLGMRQIADAVSLLDKFTQENASIADQANTIARETQSISVEVVENVNKNTFESKYLD